MYSQLASVYDKLMGDIPYDRFVGLWEEMLAKTGLATDQLIDMGCGTGMMIPQFLRRARRVVGVDPSLEMLAQAEQRVASYGRRVSFVQARAEAFASPVKADGCMAFCDVLSYTRSQEELARSFETMAKALKPDGWVLFDVHSPHKVLEGIGDNLYGDIRDEEIAIMKTEVAVANLEVTYDVVLLLRESDGRYARYEERHVQRAFELEILLQALAQAGFARVTLGADFEMWWGNPEDELTTPRSADVCQLEKGAGIRIDGEPRLSVMAQADRWFFFARKS
ncbi:MAG: class I SAM-dependent methyltransferase [Firmicutes bacterium]|nr:class I SAM-dependent methyltransferase [Bacillota bacterium]